MKAFPKIPNLYRCVLIVMFSSVVFSGCDSESTLAPTEHHSLSVPDLSSLSAKAYEVGESLPKLVVTNNGGGYLTGCYADTLPEGIDVAVSADGKTCEIGGTPLSLQSRTAHWITATNSAGSSQATVELEIVSRAFVTTWDIPDLPAPYKRIVISTSGEGYNYSVDWGDGVVDTNQTGDSSHTYNQPGTYTVSIRGDFPHILACKENGNLATIEQWGDIQWKSMRQAFRGCYRLVVNASDVPDLGHVTDMHGMFAMNTDNGPIGGYARIEFRSDLSSWDVSSVTDMSLMFILTPFDQDISNWDVSSVKNMEGMFCTTLFNQDISRWDVSSVENMAYMFAYNETFNQNIANWDVSSVKTMEGLFEYAEAFNQPIGPWDVSSVTSMSDMFHQARFFDQPIGNWDVSSVTDMNFLFYGASAFNQPIGNWDVSSVTYMTGMFFDASAFNQPIGNWDVSSVSNMSGMFSSASAFNQPIGNWNASSVTDMSWMFSSASAFNQSIENWDVSSVTDMRNMFEGALAFDQNIGSWDLTAVDDMTDMFLDSALSTESYNSLLQGWSVQNVKPEVVFNGGDSTYSTSLQPARDTLTKAFGWTITDGGVAP